MNPFDSLVNLVSSLNFKRWFALVVILSTACACAWLADLYVGFSKYYRTERAIELIDKMALIEHRGPTSPDLAKVQGQAIEHISALLDSERPIVDAAKTSGSYNWWKFASGALPWLIITLSGWSALAKEKEKNLWAHFLGTQVFTVTFGFINVFLTPTTGLFWMDHIAFPWGICVVFIVVCLLIPLTLVAIAASNKVREKAMRVTITNNLRQLAAAADQFYLENGVTEATYAQLVGEEKSKYIRHIQSVDGERYDLIEFKAGKPLRVTRRSGEVIELPVDG